MYFYSFLGPLLPLHTNVDCSKKQKKHRERCQIHFIISVWHLKILLSSTPETFQMPQLFYIHKITDFKPLFLSESIWTGVSCILFVGLREALDPCFFFFKERLWFWGTNNIGWGFWRLGWMERWWLEELGEDVQDNEMEEWEEQDQSCVQIAVPSHTGLLVSKLFS